MPTPTSHKIARKLLALPDLVLLDEYAENQIVDVTTGDYDAGEGEAPCIMYETAEYEPSNDGDGEPEE
jgi:hypothetical protein